MDTKRKDMLVYGVIAILFIALFWLCMHHTKQETTISYPKSVTDSNLVQVQRWEESEKLIIDKAKNNPKVTLKSNKSHIGPNEYIILTLSIDSTHKIDTVALDFNTPFEKNGIVNIQGICKLSENVYQIRCSLLAKPGSEIILQTPKGLVMDSQSGFSDNSNSLMISL